MEGVLMEEIRELLKKILEELKTLNQSIKAQIESQQKMYLESKGQTDRAMGNLMASLSPGMRGVVETIIKGKKD